MDINMLKVFFMWCTIINFGFLLFSFIMVTVSGNLAYKMHSKWFPMTKEKFTFAMYLFIGIYKILFFVFNVVPWIALEIIV